jgi:hypothetical protein
MMVALSFSSARAPPDKLVQIDGTALSDRFVDLYSVVFINSYTRAKTSFPKLQLNGTRPCSLERKTFHGQ